MTPFDRNFEACGASSTWQVHRNYGSWLRLGVLALATAATSVLAASTFVPDSQPTGWVTRPALTRYNLTSGNEVIYRAEYIAGQWTGQLSANAIDAYAQVDPYPAWSVTDAGLLLASNNWDTGRRIATVKSDGTRIAFRWNLLQTSQQDSIDTNDAKSANIVNYVRGDRSNEAPAGAAFRPRTSVLGDIQHSTLLHWRHNDGSRRLYVGANDGMLHVFNAATGDEVFAYVPSMIIPKLKLLVANPYVHTLYVDGPLSIANVVLSGPSASTLLVGGLGGGGRGLFCLDVTTPNVSTETEAASKIKWEISNATSGFANLGYTYAEPKFARLNTGAAAVVVGNGYVNAGNGQASLYLINADTGALLREIGTGSGTTSNPNGLSSPTLVDVNSDGKVDYVYAGDIDGNLWKFDLTGTDISAYSVTKIHTTSPAQAITTAPVVYAHPAGGRMVIFGTGRMLNAADATSTATHYVYGLWDGRPTTNTTWLNQTLTETTVTPPSGVPLRVRTGSTNVPNWLSGGHMGWRLTLPAGERIVGENPLYNDERFYFTSTNPTIPPPAADRPKGANWLQEVNYLTGGSPPRPVFDINHDGLFDASDLVSSAIPVGLYLGPGVYSQPVVADMSARATTLFATNTDLSVPPPSTGDPGVSGGHFDVDIYYGPPGGFTKVQHVHEYDDKFDVTGVNFLAPSEPKFNFANAVTSTATPFKILVMNQYLNPAAKLSIGGGAYASVKDYGILASSTDAGAVVASLPTYTRATIGSFVFNLPRDAFAAKDWWGDGILRSGLIPTKTGCVNGISNKTTGATSNPGPNGERHDGALTIQIIKDTTPASALELNYAAGGAKYGWRVKAADFSSYVLAEYTTFWHHPNGICYGDSGWIPAPPQDFDSSSGGAPPPGSEDPRGSFSLLPDGDGVTLTGVTTTVSGSMTTYTYHYSDGTTKTETRTYNGDGSVTIVNDGGTSTIYIGGSLDSGEQEVLNRSRRINWREVIAR